MHSFQFKIKGYMSEVGEYTEFFPAEPSTIIQFIIQHWFNETLPNNLDCIVIKDTKGDLLVIDHLKRDVFDYYFLPQQKKKTYYHRKTDIQLMFFLLEGFFSGRTEDLTSNLKEKDDDCEFVRGDMVGKSFLYRMTTPMLWRNLNWMFYQSFFILLFLSLSLVVHPIVLAVVVVFVIFAVTTNYQRIRMYRQYYRDNKNLEVTISRANEQMTIKKDGWSRIIPKTDIRKLTRVIPPPNDVHAHADYYLEIEFLNGDVLNLTCLMISQIDADGKFLHNLIPFESEVSKTGFLRRNTELSHYFSAIGLKD